MWGFLGLCFAEPLSWVISGAAMVLCYVWVQRRLRRNPPVQTST